MITYQHEKFNDYFEEAKDLLQKHYEEIAERTDVIKLDPDVDRYNALEQNGMLETHTIRDNGVLIGYSLWFVSYNIHYKQSLVASSDVLYIAPNYRKGMIGVKFIKWTTEEIKKRKPQKIVFHVKPFMDYGHLLERQGANYFEKLYSIVLE
jgi:hypothetical protein